MIRAPATYPHAGSFALFADPLEPRPIVNGEPATPRLHLVRIMARSAEAAQITFPLREGVASGTRTVDLAELIDCTPINVAEAQELADIQRHLKGRTRLTPKMKAQKARADALEQRTRMAALAAPMLLRLSRRGERPQRSAARLVRW